MPTLRVRLRAYPAVQVGQRDVPLALKRGLALLSMLVELERKIPRAQLCDLLWPDAASEVARGRLRRLVHETNRILGVDAVVGDADAVWLSGAIERVESDVDQVRRLARRVVMAPADMQSREALEELLQPDAHAVLEGFEIGSERFEEWVAQRRSEQHRLVARALRRAGEQLVDCGQPRLAAEAAARLIAIEPLADAGHALLLRAHAGCGDLAALEASYCAFADLLRDELGVRPSPAYEALYEEARVRVTQVLPATGDPVIPVDSAPPIQFADAEDGCVAYLEIGNGPTTLFVMFGVWSHIELAWDEPSIRSILLRLAKRFRVVLIDRRGVGLSDRLGPEQSVPAGVQDLEAVRRAVGADRVWLFGNSVGSMIAIEYAALHAEAVAGLVLYAASARGTWAPDYPWAMTAAQLQKWLDQLRSDWGRPTSLAAFAPSQADDAAARAWWARLLRQAMSRNSLPGLLAEYGRMDVRSRLAQVAAPTLVLQRDADRVVRLGAARFIAEQIPGARLKVLAGQDHNLWAGDAGAVIDELERFVLDIAQSPEAEPGTAQSARGG
jgi:pimeloyl-ACP methyl ester carboxylesterase/DNA-binding SARP family transcriptional activator